MKSQLLVPGNLHRLIGPIAVAIAIGLAAPAIAQTVTATTPEQPGANALRVEVSTSRNLFSPRYPVWLRLTLHNASDEPLVVPTATVIPTSDGISLPQAVVFGSPVEPALMITRDDESPVPIPPPTDLEQPVGDVLRLGPHSSVGTEVDLRRCFPAVRYKGIYRVEWRPLGGLAGSSSVEFQVEPRQDAIMVLDQGKITFTLAYDEAPRNVENFLELVREGFYSRKTIHRIIPGFVIYGGCPRGDGTGVRPDGKLIPAEFSDAPFDVGTLAMSRKPSDPNSASCQFFITLARIPELDGQYTIIGQATDEESLRTLNQLAAEATDSDGRPRSPLVIRSINLDSAELSGVTRFDLKASQPSNRSSSDGTSETSADKP